MATLTDSTRSWGCTTVCNCGFSSHFPNDIEHLFTCLSFIDLSWNVYSKFFPIFSLGCLHYFLLLSVKFFLYFECVSYQVSDLQMFPPHLCLSFGFPNVVFKLWWSTIYHYLSLVGCTFTTYLWNLWVTLNHEGFLLWLSLTFQFMIHFELMFLYGKRI